MTKLAVAAGGRELDVALRKFMQHARCRPAILRQTSRPYLAVLPFLETRYIKRTCLFELISTTEKETAVRLIVVFMLETLHRPFSRLLLPWLTGASQHPMQSINAAVL